MYVGRQTCTLLIRFLKFISYDFMQKSSFSILNPHVMTYLKKKKIDAIIIGTLFVILILWF